MALQKWIDLRDRSSGARLKLDEINGQRFLFIVGLSRNNPRWAQAINVLGFQASPNQKFLIRLVRADERIKASSFAQVWPDARYADIEVSQIRLNLSRTKSKDRTEEERSIANELASARRLGRNLDGDEVYSSGAGRFIYREDRGIVAEMAGLRPAMFLRAPDAQSLDGCADGFVRSLLRGEVQRTDDLVRFIEATTDRPPEAQTPEDLDLAHEVIDAACVRHLTRDFDTANDAYGDSVRLYEYMPGYRGTSRGRAAMPIPLSVIAQRLLGDTSGKTVVLPNAFDGAAFAFLPKATRVRAFRGSRDLSARAAGLQREGLEWLGEFRAAQEGSIQALFYNADPEVGPDGARLDYRDALVALRAVEANGRAVFVLAGDDALHPGELSAPSRAFLDALHARAIVEDVFEVGRELTQQVGTEGTLRVIACRNQPVPLDENGRPPRAPARLSVCHSWDDVKARVDESLARAAVREAESEGIELEKIAQENRLQRPYIAFSRVSEAITMVPKELQAPLQAFMSDLESQVGPVDEFVEREMGFAGDRTLASRFSAEQVDALAMIIQRMKRRRGHILGDETGIGKGRILAGLAVWALKQDIPVVFITDRANLFSDMARDMRDIGEWGRVRPLVMNSDGRIEDTIGDAGVLAEGMRPQAMRALLAENTPLREAGANMVFATYSQISTENSEKALWLKNQLSDALLIVDEAHVAAGSDSNTATQVTEMASLAAMVQYSSATWAKSADNLHIFARAFPPSVNAATLAVTMKRGGEAFSEVFSSMLAREGALIRREHDLSKLEFVVEVDRANAGRNNAVADRTAEVMSALAYTAGALKRIVTRMSDINVAALRDAREVRGTAETAKLFKSRFGTGGMLYQVNRRLNAALNVDNTVRLVLEGIEQGRKPVVVFEDTGASFVKQALQQQSYVNEDGVSVVPSLLRAPTVKDLLLRMVDTLQMVRIEEVTIEDLPDLEAEAAAEEREDQAARQAADAEEPVDMAGQVVEAQAPGDQVTTAPADAPAPTTAAQEDGVVIAEAVAAIDGAPGGAAAPQQPIEQAGRSGARRKGPRPFKTVPFWEVGDVSEADRKTFREGLDEIHRLIDSLPEIPLNVPDEIARRLGESGLRVGELSGRSFALQPASESEAAEFLASERARLAARDPAGANDGTAPRAPTGPLYRIVPRPKSKSQVNATVRAFNSGLLDSLVINRSAATGLSLHASPRFADRRRRQLVEMQIPENPTDRIQLYGRVNRFDQESFPLIQVASTGIFGEVRQIMMQNKKLAAMSANVRSSRDSHAIVKDVPDLLNPIGSGICRQFLVDNPEIVAKLDIDASVLEDDKRWRHDLASLLTSRIPLLRLDEQRQVYEQLYAMFEDAVLQAELAGENPFKPKEMDVRAEVTEPQLFFGFDHRGLGSAFDGAVFVRHLSWEEQRRPMAFEAVLEVVRANRQRLVDEGRATSTGATSNGFVEIEIDELVRRASLQLEGRARLAIAGTQFKSSAEALASLKPNPIRVGMAKASWVAQCLGKLVPGRLIRHPIKAGDVSQGWRSCVVLDLVPPPDRRESQLAQWRVLTLEPGREKPVSTTLHALIGPLRTRPAEPGQPMEVYSDLEIGDDLIRLHDVVQRCLADEVPPGRPMMARLRTEGVAQYWFYEDFRRRYASSVRRSAMVLTGNMYLASEWASSTKAGGGVIFTDNAGGRHRGVLLNRQFQLSLVNHLPVRLWLPGMIDRFVERLLDGSIPRASSGYVFNSSFDGAWKAGRGEPRAKDGIVFLPGSGVAMSVTPAAKRRINAMLRQAQKAIKEELYPGVKVRAADDPGHVVIKESRARAQRLAERGEDDAGQSSRGQGSSIMMQAETPEQLRRAMQMLRRGPGLEIFVPTGDRQLLQAARECVREYFVERLRDEAGADPRRREQVEEMLSQLEDDDGSGRLSEHLQRMIAEAAQAPDDDDDLRREGQQQFDFLSGEALAADPADDEEPADDQDGESAQRPRLAA